MYEKIINKIQNVRSNNNVNWMNLLRLAIKENPIDTISILSQIYESDLEISKLVKLLKNFSSFKKIIKMQRAKISDSSILLEWRNDKNCRRVSKNTKIISFREHTIWFQNFLKDKNSFLYIFRLEELNLGMVRLDYLQNYDYLISIIVDQGFRNLGIGKLFLKKIFQKHKKFKFYAHIKTSNKNSIDLFLSLGFKKINKKNDFLVFVKA